MDKIDSLILKAQKENELTDLEKLNIDNPYLGKTFEELVDYLSGDNYRAPEMHTEEWSKFIWAMMGAPSGGGGLTE